MNDTNYLSGFDTKSYDNKKSVNNTFTPKHVFSLKNNPISGITIDSWLKIIYNYGKYIELKYLLRVGH